MIKNSETTRLVNSSASGKRKLTREQLLAIRKGAAASGGLLALVAGGYALMQASASRNAEEAVAEEVDLQEEVCEEVEKPVIHSTAPIASNVSDEMSFAEAFEAARGEVGPGGVFVWRGQPYHTYSAEEWSAMGESDQMVYLDSLESGLAVEEEALTAESAPELSSAGTEGIATPVAGTSSGAAPDVTAPKEELIELTPLSIDNSGDINGVGVDFGADGVVELIMMEGTDPGSPDAWVIDADSDGAIELRVFTDQQGNIVGAEAIDPPLPTSAYIAQHRAGEAVIMTEAELNERLSESQSTGDQSSVSENQTLEDHPDDVYGSDYEEDGDVSDMSV